MTKSMKSMTLAAIAAAAALLALTGCSGGDAAAPSGNGAPAIDEEVPTADAVFDFTSNEAITGPSISFELPEGLVAVATAYADNRLLDAVTVTGLETESSKFCAVRLDFSYADGDNTVALIKDSDWYDGRVTAEPGWEANEKFGLTLLAAGGVNAQVGEADLAEPGEKGVWFTDDYTSAVQITECASTPYDPRAVEDMWFPVTLKFTAAREGDSSVSMGQLVADTLATVKLTVMKNGDVTLVENEVNGFVLDSNGTWIED